VNETIAISLPGFTTGLTDFNFDTVEIQQDYVFYLNDQPLPLYVKTGCINADLNADSVR
jgi:hypothetical protein